jgi:hypothetical protein
LQIVICAVRGLSVFYSKARVMQKDLPCLLAATSTIGVLQNAAGL